MCIEKLCLTIIDIEQAKSKKAQAHQKINKDEQMLKNMEVWNEQIIPNFDSMRSKPQTLNMCYEWGVPPKLRGPVWELAIGNQLKINQTLYEILKKKRFEDKQENASIEREYVQFLNLESLFSLIKIDLARTFPALQFFREGGPLYFPFKEVLECYARFRPEK